MNAIRFWNTLKWPTMEEGNLVCTHEDLCSAVFKHLTAKELVMFCYVSKFHKRIAEKDFLWVNLIERDFPRYRFVPPADGSPSRVKFRYGELLRQWQSYEPEYAKALSNEIPKKISTLALVSQFLYEFLSGTMDRMEYPVIVRLMTLVSMWCTKWDLEFYERFVTNSSKTDKYIMPKSVKSSAKNKAFYCRLLLYFFSYIVNPLSFAYSCYHLIFRSTLDQQVCALVLGIYCGFYNVDAFRNPRIILNRTLALSMAKLACGWLSYLTVCLS